MRRILSHLLLGLALIFQGTGTVCAAGAMTANMGSHVQIAGMPDGIQACMDSQACPNCPGGHMATHDCMQNCSLPAGLTGVAYFMPPIPLGDALSLLPPVSLVDYRQVPPTPPPIA